MASVIVNPAKVRFAKGLIAWESDTIKILLVTSGYTVNIDTHEFVSSVTNELAVSGYVRKTLAGCTVSQDSTNDRAELSATNPVWTALAAGSPAAAVVFKQVTNDADSPIIGVIDFIDTPSSGSDWTLKFNSTDTSGVVFRIG